MWTRLKRWWFQHRTWTRVACRDCGQLMFVVGFWPNDQCASCELHDHDQWLNDLKTTGRIRF